MDWLGNYYWDIGILVVTMFELAVIFGKDRRLVTVSQWTKDGRFIANFKSISEASRQTGTSYNGIGKCCRGIEKSSGGYVWRYGKYKQV